MPGRLSKQSFLNSLACPRLGWYSRLETPPVQLVPDQGTVAERLPVEEAKDIHERSRSLFLDAPLVSRPGFDAACGQTLDLLDRPSTTAVLDAAFGTSTCRARADVLVRTADSWYLYKVKDATWYTNEIVDELAYEWMVIDASGVSLSGASVLLESDKYRSGASDRALFASPMDLTSQVFARASEFKKLLPQLDAATRASAAPAPRLIPHCRRCPLLRSCVGAGISNHIVELPHLSAAQLQRLAAHGYRAIADIPDSTSLTKRQAIVWRSVTSGRPILTGDLKGHLSGIQWPAYYLDLETVSTAMPLFPDVAPFEQLPFLYAIRTCDRPGSLLEHRAFLSSQDRTGIRELADRLLQDVGSEGSILVYSEYQIRVIRALALRFPGLADALRRLLGRTFVMEPIIHQDFYHPAFHGRTSLRSVVQALVPGFTYIDLEIEDAASARASFAFLVKGDYYSPARAPLIRRDLYAYCARDTLALVRVHEALQDLAGS